MRERRGEKKRNKVNKKDPFRTLFFQGGSRGATPGIVEGGLYPEKIHRRAKGIGFTGGQTNPTPLFTFLSGVVQL